MTSPRPSSRLGPYLAIALLGFAIVAAGQSADPRASRRARLADLIAVEDQRSRSLRLELDQLQGRIEMLERQAGSRQDELGALREQIDRLASLAGTGSVQGPGLVVELRDSALREAPSGDPNDLVVHEHDLQAVVNALWAGGAEAVAINGERITSNSAVRCVGNTLLLHGSVYAPPYRVAAVGSRAALLRSLDVDPMVERFRVFAEELHLGFDVQNSARLVLPAFRGPVTGARALD